MTGTPKRWSVQPLGNIVDILDSHRIPVSARERASRTGAVAYYGAAGQVGWIDQAIFNEPLVLLGEDGVQFFDPFRPKAYRVAGPAWVNNHAHVLRATEDIDWRFLEHYLNWFDYRGYANGTTRLKLTQAAMRRIPVPLPSPNEQRRIVEVLEGHLSHLDAAAELLGRARARVTVFPEAVLQATTAVAEAPRMRLSELIREPLMNGHSVPTRADGFPVLRLTALANGQVALGERKSGAWGPDQARPFLVTRGDFLIARGNGSLRLVGRGAQVIDEPDPVAFPDTMIRIRPNESLINSSYFAAIWNSRTVRSQIEKLAQTTAGIYKINQKHLNAVELPVPNLEAQELIARRLGDATGTTARTATEAGTIGARLFTLRRALLNAAFSDRLTVQSPDLNHSKELANA